MGRGGTLLLLEVVPEPWRTSYRPLMPQWDRNALVRGCPSTSFCGSHVVTWRDNSNCAQIACTLNTVLLHSFCLHIIFMYVNILVVLGSQMGCVLTQH